MSIGFDRASVVMINEGHNGLARCIRTRKVGRRVLPIAHEAGCRIMAMEALPNRGEGPSRHTKRPEGSGYLAQPEMVELIDAALGMGWTLVGYEADLGLAPSDLGADTMTLAFSNWREEVQAHNLATAIGDLHNGGSVLVWVGNGHHSKQLIGAWSPMGYLLYQAHRIESFCIDQLPTVSLSPESPPLVSLTRELAERLDAMGGTAGFTADDRPRGFCAAGEYDAWLLSTDNTVVMDPGSCDW